MAHWQVRRKGKVIAHSESPDQVIKRAAKALVGKRLCWVVLEKIILADSIRHAARFGFDGGLTLHACGYKNHKPDSIFLLYSPTRVLFYENDGSVISKKREALNLKAIKRRLLSASAAPVRKKLRVVCRS